MKNRARSVSRAFSAGKRNRETVERRLRRPSDRWSDFYSIKSWYELTIVPNQCLQSLGRVSKLRFSRRKVAENRCPISLSTLTSLRRNSMDKLLSRVRWDNRVSFSFLLGRISFPPNLNAPILFRIFLSVLKSFLERIYSCYALLREFHRRVHFFRKSHRAILFYVVRYLFVSWFTSCHNILYYTCYITIVIWYFNVQYYTVSYRVMQYFKIL